MGLGEVFVIEVLYNTKNHFEINPTLFGTCLCHPEGVSCRVGGAVGQQPSPSVTKTWENISVLLRQDENTVQRAVSN